MDKLKNLRDDFSFISKGMALAMDALDVDEKYKNSAERDVLCFMLSLAVADGKLTCGELDVISAVLGETVTAEHAIEILTNFDYDSYMHCILVSLQILVNMDNVIVWNRMEHTVTDVPTKFIELYKAIGEAVICADGEASKEAKERLRYFIHNLGEYVNETSERRHKYGLIDYDALMGA